MRVYLVRHGRTASNDAWRYQTGDTRLSALGEEQAKRLGERFSRVPVDAVLASDLMRAKQTAEAIAAKINAPITFTNLLHERRRSAALCGKWYGHPLSIYVISLGMLRRRNKAWHHSDEENAYEMRTRAESALTLIETHTAENLVVVSHSLLLKMILVLIALKEVRRFPSMKRFFRTHWPVFNASVTTCEYDRSTGHWKVLDFNDTSHLV